MKNWQKAALIHAFEEQPFEACGFVVGTEYVRCENIHPTPTSGFQIGPEDYLKAANLGEIRAVFHSHVNTSANPSMADRVECEHWGVPWYIVGLPSRTWKHIEPSGFELPLLGRPFIHGTIDCWTAVRDGLKQYYGVEVRDFDRWDGWWNDPNAPNLYRDNYEIAGFRDTGRRADDLRPGDMLVMNLSSPADRPSHAALYVGNNEIFHHPPDQVSRIDPFGGYWREITRDVMRHKDLPDA